MSPFENQKLITDKHKVENNWNFEESTMLGEKKI